jgi:signal peptidase I
VVFRDPGGWLVDDPSIVPAATPHTPVARAASWVLGLAGLGGADRDDHLVKRVIGLPGDHVRCCNDLGQMSVNGVPLREPYLRLPPGITAASAKAFSVTVPAGDLWVMGDNRNNSEDSRFHRDLPTRGFVPMRDVTGRAIAISWPARRWTWLDDYGQVFRGVEEHGASG